MDLMAVCRASEGFLDDGVAVGGQPFPLSVQPAISYMDKGTVAREDDGVAVGDQPFPLSVQPANSYIQ